MVLYCQGKYNGYTTRQYLIDLRGSISFMENSPDKSDTKDTVDTKDKKEGFARNPANP